MKVSYVLTNGNGLYIMKNAAGQYIPIESDQDCEHFDSRLKAENVRKSSIRQKLRETFKVKEIIDYSAPDQSNEIDIRIKYRPKQEQMKSLVSKPEEEVEIPQLRDSVICTLMAIENIQQRKEELKEKHSQVEKEIVDIEHYIELSENLNAYQGWLAYMMLRKRLKTRRKIKDEIQVLSDVDDVVNGLRKTVSQIDSLKNKKYAPRALKELFT